MPGQSLLPDVIHKLVSLLQKMIKEIPHNVLLCALKYEKKVTDRN